MSDEIKTANGVTVDAITAANFAFRRKQGTCAVHGRVYEFSVNHYDDSGVKADTGPICPICYVEWTRQNVTPLTDLS